LKKQLEELKFKQDIQNGLRVAKKIVASRAHMMMEQAKQGLKESLANVDTAEAFTHQNTDSFETDLSQNLTKNLLPNIDETFTYGNLSKQRHFKYAAHRNMMMVQRKANFRKRQSVVCYSIYKTSDDHYINDDGSIISVRANCGKERFFVQDHRSPSATGYKLIAELEKNDDGLVLFPSKGVGFERYGTNDAGGVSTSPKEIVGSGDHYLLPETAAALFGVINKLHNDYKLVVSLGDMSSSNGSDPWQQGFKHHAGHGHNGKRSGMDVDFRYLNQGGTSFQSVNAFGDSSYSALNNQRVYDTAELFGFTENYQGTKGALSGVKKVKGHNDHGHLGLDYKNLKWKYSRTAPVYGAHKWFNQFTY